jgi:hypothetical protein
MKEETSMRATIKVRMRPESPWVPAILTTERAESSYGQPVVVVEGTTYGAGEVWSVHVRARSRYAEAARQAGYRLE